MRRAAMIGALAIAAAVLSPAAASAADVSVTGPRGGETKTVSIGSLADSFDVSATYKLVGSNGQATTQQIRGISIRGLLAAIDADPAYGAVQVIRPNGGYVLITRAQIEAAGPTPVIYEDSGAATFLRPSSGTGDPNANDIVSVTGGPLLIKQVETAPYKVKVTASKTRARAKELVKFSATATGAGAGQKLTYTWNFDDGKRASGQAVSHRFARRGTYAVLVTVRGEGEDASSPAVVRVQVGKAAASEKQRTGGGTNDAAGAPDSGQADGASGNGAQAGTADAQSSSASAKRKSRPRAAAEQLTPVTGELLTAATPEQQSALAARSGQPALKQQGSFAVPKEAIGGAAVLCLLGLGAGLEFGGASALRRRLSA